MQSTVAFGLYYYYYHLPTPKMYNCKRIVIRINFEKSLDPVNKAFGFCCHSIRHLTETISAQCLVHLHHQYQEYHSAGYIYLIAKNDIVEFNLKLYSFSMVAGCHSSLLDTVFSIQYLPFTNTHKNSSMHNPKV